MTTFPVEALVRRVLNGRPEPSGSPHPEDPEETWVAVAEIMWVSPETLHRWRRTGMTILQAENAAERCGFLPCEVWPNYYQEVLCGAN